MEGVAANEVLFLEKYRQYYEKQPSKRPYTSAQLKEVNMKLNVFEVKTSSLIFFYFYNFQIAISEKWLYRGFKKKAF